jgi:Flp pilus assembly protein TadD
MFLQRLTRISPLVIGLAAMLALAACAGSGSARDTADSQQRDEIAEEGELTAPVIPAEILTLYEQATSVMAAGDFVDAELRLKEFVLLYPNFPGAYVNLAIIHAHNENDAETRAALDVALALDPDHPAALNQMGMLLRRNGDFLEAEAAYLKAVTVSPDYALAHYNLGVLNELYLQRLEVALSHFEAYQALVGDDKQVEKWIADLTRRVAANQRTANVAE